MEQQFQLTLNGQQVITDDFNLLGRVAALADDRVLAELFRLTPYDGSSSARGILPYETEAGGPSVVVESNGATGQVKINPFRALIGSRTPVASDAKANWRDIRSSVAVGSTTLHQTVSIGANSSGNPRWDLVVAAVAVDANGTSVTRKVKNPITKVITGTSVVTTLVTNVTLSVVEGTPATNPIWPAVPSDSGNVYYIPLAYIRVPDGFDATSTVGANDIVEMAPCLNVSRAMGVSCAEPANTQYVVSTTRQQAWGAASGVRPTTFIPPSFTGLHTLFIALDLANANAGLHSHLDGEVLDTRDWRGRLCFWQACVTSGLLDANGFPWEDGMPETPGIGTVFTGSSMFPDAISEGIQSGNTFWTGAGQTIVKTFHELFPNSSLIARLDSEQSAQMDGEIAIVCDHANGGVLRLYKPGNPRCRIFLKLDFTAPYSNKVID